MLRVGVVVLGVGDVDRAAAFWGEALGYEMRTNGFGGWATVLISARWRCRTQDRIAAQQDTTAGPLTSAWIFTYPALPSRWPR
jgi:hypothetical protein